jgi:hypothetical protein
LENELTGGNKMAMEWSHTVEALDHAREELYNIDRNDLIVIAAEWDTHEHSDKAGVAFDQAYYEGRVKLYGGHAVSTLAEMIWERMEQLRSATNDGSEFWACPYGCHLVSVG